MRWRLLAELVNDGSHERATVTLPPMRYRFADGAPVRQFDPVYGGVLQPHTSPLHSRYPGRASFCTTFATGEKQALGIGLFNEAQRPVRIAHVPGGTSGQIELSYEKLSVERRRRETLPEGFVSVGATWGDALRPYREWLLSTYGPASDPPQWYWHGDYANTRLAHVLTPVTPPDSTPGVWVFDHAAEPRRLDAIKSEVDEAVRTLGTRKLRPLFYQFGWWRRMAAFEGLLEFDALCGDYTEAHELTRPVIDYIHSRGGRTFLYTNFIAAGTHSRFFREHPEAFVRDADGFARRNGEYPMVLFDPSASIMRDFWHDALRFILSEDGLDADGVFLDQVGGGTACPTHDDPAFKGRADHYGADYLDLLDFVCRRAREIRPDALVAGELPSDVRSMWLDQTHAAGYNRARPVRHEHPQQAADAPPHEYLAFLNFVNPKARIEPAGRDLMAVGAPGLPDDELWRQFRDVFAHGLSPCPTEPLGVMAYLFGPVNGRAILSVRAHEAIGRAVVHLPQAMLPAVGATDVATRVGRKIVRVDAGKTARFYLLEVEPD